jgi:hypothetical protein
LADVELQRIDQGKYSDNGKNTHSYAQKRKQCPQNVGFQGSQSKKHAFQKEDKYLFQGLAKAQSYILIAVFSGIKYLICLPWFSMVNFEDE